MSDVAARIRERLDAFATAPAHFTEAPEDATPEDVATWQAHWDALFAAGDAELHRLVMLPHTARFEPLPDPRNAALLAVLELHEGEDGAPHECPGRDPAHGHVTDYERNCATLRAIAAKLGIEVDRG